MVDSSRFLPEVVRVVGVGRREVRSGTRVGLEVVENRFVPVPENVAGQGSEVLVFPDL